MGAAFIGDPAEPTVREYLFSFLPSFSETSKLKPSQLNTID
jgi:hypothetical protein